MSRRPTSSYSPHCEEGSGSLSVLEALQAGTAVLASEVDGILEDVADGDSALLVPAGDPAVPAAALRRVLSDADLRRRLAPAVFEGASLPGLRLPRAGMPTPNSEPSRNSHGPRRPGHSPTDRRRGHARVDDRACLLGPDRRPPRHATHVERLDASAADGRERAAATSGEERSRRRRRAARPRTGLAKIRLA